MANKLRRLNVRNEKPGRAPKQNRQRGLLLTEMQRGKIEKQVAEITDFITAGEARKPAVN